MENSSLLPLALQRMYHSIQSFLRKGNRDESNDVDKHGKIDIELRQELECRPDPDKLAYDMFNNAPSFICGGFTVGDICSSNRMSTDQKCFVELGFYQLFQETMQHKYRLINPSNLKWRRRRAITADATTSGVVVNGINKEIWLWSQRNNI